MVEFDELINEGGLADGVVSHSDSQLEENQEICPSCGLQQYENERKNCNEKFHPVG